MDCYIEPYCQKTSGMTGLKIQNDASDNRIDLLRAMALAEDQIEKTSTLYHDWLCCPDHRRLQECAGCL